MVDRWQKRIVKECSKRLGRKLSQTEELFITSRGSFLALEMIEDTVRTLEGADLAAYLNSESQATD